jgi:hypothetical protein
MSQVGKGSRLTKKKTGNALRVAKQRIQDINLIKGLAISYAILALLPIVWTPLTADDIPNSKSRIYISDMSGDFFSNYVSVFLSNTQQWINAEGRFFPGATFYALGIHTIFQGIGLYKVYLFAISLTLFLLLFQVMVRVLPFNFAALGTIFALSGYSLRYRYFHDGISSFAGQVPFAGVLFLLSILLLIDNKFAFKKFAFPISIFSFVFAALTYEHVVTFIPGVVIFLFFNSPKIFRKRNVLTFSSLLFLQLILTLKLRSGVKSAPAYTLDFESLDFLRTAFKQLLSPLPASQFLFSKPGFLGAVEQNYLLHNLVWIFIFCVGFITIGLRAFQRLAVDNFTKTSWLKLVSIGLLGLNMLIIPSLLTGATLRWQSELPSGEGYLCVVLQSIGLGFFMASLVAALENFATHKQRRLGATCALIFVAFLISQNIAWNWGFNY